MSTQILRWLVVIAFASTNPQQTKLEQCATELQKSAGHQEQVSVQFKAFPEKVWSSERHLAALEKQLREAAEFVCSMMRDGQGRCPFSVLTLRPKSWVNIGRPLLSWTGGEELTLSLNRLPWPLGFKVYDAVTLRNFWESGKQLPARTLIRKRWEILNPVGGLRLFVRKTLIDAANLLKTSVQALRSGVKSGRIVEKNHFIAEILSVIKSHALLDTLSKDTRQALEQMERLTTDELLVILASIEEYLGNDQHIHEVVESVALAAQVTLDQYDNQVKTLATGLVAVTNDHMININFSAFGTGQLRHVRVTPQRRHYNGKAIGILVGVCTSDLVGVRINYAGAIQSAAIEHALQQFSKKLISGSRLNPLFENGASDERVRYAFFHAISGRMRKWAV